MPKTRKKRNLIQFVFDAHSINLAEGEGTQTSTVTVIKMGTYDHWMHGKFKVDQETFDSFINNFNDKTYGQELPVDINHDDGKGAAGWFKRLFVEGKRLRAEIEWTEVGVDAIRKKLYRYMSATYTDNYVAADSGKAFGPLLMGAALCIRPFVKGMEPVTLSASGETEQIFTIFHEKLSKEIDMNKEKILKQLKEMFLGIKGFTEAMHAHLVVALSAIVTGEETEEQIKSLFETFEPTAKGMITLAEAGKRPDGDGNTPPAPPKTLSADDVNSLISQGVAKALADRDDAAKQLAEQTTANRKAFTDAINAREKLDPKTKELLLSAAETITGDMTEAQVKVFAETQLKLADQMDTQKQLHGMGFDTQAGRVQVIRPEEVGHLQLAEEKILTAVGRKQLSDAMRYPNMGKVSEPAKAFADKVVGLFDNLYGRHLSAEVKQFAAGDQSTGDTSLPYSVIRTVIREAVQDVVALNFVTADVAAQNSLTVLIPYITRDLTGMNSDIHVNEGGVIPYAGYTQGHEMAYLRAKKLATQLSNELAFFTRNGSIDFDALRDNFALVVQVVRERVDRLLHNEILDSADEYGAVAVSAEDIEPQFDGATSALKTAQYPICRPRIVRDIQGNQIGSTTTPITMTYDGNPITEYAAGVAAGTYFRITDYNMGLFELVDEDGVAQTPADTTLCTITYSYASNVVKFDTGGAGTTDWDLYLNGLLRDFGRRKALMQSSDRMSMPNFAMMSPVLNQTFTEARQFEAGSKVEGTGLTNDGNLAMIKGVPAFGTNAPSLTMGDVRAVIGERGTTHYRVAKPFTMGDAFEAVDPSTGKPVGKKQAYGEEYSVEHTPTPSKYKYTSLLVGDITNR